MIREMELKGTVKRAEVSVLVYNLFTNLSFEREFEAYTGCSFTSSKYSVYLQLTVFFNRTGFTNLIKFVLL